MQSTSWPSKCARHSRADGICCKELKSDEWTLGTWCVCFPFLADTYPMTNTSPYSHLHWTLRWLNNSSPHLNCGLSSLGTSHVILGDCWTNHRRDIHGHRWLFSFTSRTRPFLVPLPQCHYPAVRFVQSYSEFMRSVRGDGKLFSISVY